MTKKQELEMTYEYIKSASDIDTASESLAKVLENAFKALCAINPEAALDVVDQINKQRYLIEQTVEENVAHRETFLSLANTTEDN